MNDNVVPPPAPGVVLRRLREQRGLSLRDLAKLVAFDWSYLAQVERGERVLTRSLAERADEALAANGELITALTNAGASEDVADVMKDAGVIELPDERPDYGTAWERHDDPEQQP